jgi:hypothetical protein
MAQLYPRALDSLSVASYDSRGLRWKYSNPPPHGVNNGSVCENEAPKDDQMEDEMGWATWRNAFKILVDSPEWK